MYNELYMYTYYITPRTLAHTERYNTTHKVPYFATGFIY